MNTKLIIIEGGDQLGKSTLIGNIAKYYNYDNIMIRHFSKPKDGTLSFQKRAFHSEFLLLWRIIKTPMSYYDNTVIWNRSYLGEYVYGQLYRKAKPSKLESYIYNYECGLPTDSSLILLDSSSLDFFISQEDGKSLSKQMDNKYKELCLFREIFNKSIIPNKRIVMVNNGTEFRNEMDIFNEIKDML